MGAIAEYLSQQRAPFADAPLTEVDSLVLATVAYFSFEKGTLARIEPNERVLLPVAICGIAHDDLYGDIWLSRMGGDEFLAALLASPRFMSLKVANYANEVSTRSEKQFSAITFFMQDEWAYVAYRGTDNTLAGWKEDLNLAYMKEVPSQVRARSYLEDIAGTAAARLFVGGHSKGGNLAEYAALTCRDRTFDKVERVFNHDGPGFAFSPSVRAESAEYAGKLRKTVPEGSIVGMLMENREHYRIVRSSGVLLAQHASTRWEIENGSFVTVDALSPEASIVSSTINAWAQSYEPAALELFVDTVFDLLGAANADTWTEFAEDRPARALAIASATAQLPAEIRLTIMRMLRDIAPTMKVQAAKQALGYLSGQLND